MTKSDLIEMVQGKVAGMNKKQTAEVVDALFEAVAEVIKKEKRFVYAGFGTFSVRERKARKGRNPRDGKEITIAASKNVAFKAAPSLKDAL